MSTFSKVQSSFHLTHKLWNNTQEKRKVGIVTMSNSLKLGGNLTCKKTDKNSISINNNNKKNNNNNGRFGKFGGKYVPELLITCLSELEEEFHKGLNDTKFQVGLSSKYFESFSMVLKHVVKI